MKQICTTPDLDPASVDDGSIRARSRSARGRALSVSGIAPSSNMVNESWYTELAAVKNQQCLLGAGAHGDR